MAAVVKLVKKVVKAAFKVVKTVGKIVSKTVQAVGQAVEFTVKTVGKAVESIAKAVQPLVERYAIQLALMYFGIPPQIAEPMSAAVHTMAKGGSPADALKSAATVVVVNKVGVSVRNAATNAGFTAAEAAAAESAARSAASTAAAGGNVEDILKSAAIGGVSSTAGNKVLEISNNTKLASFTMSAVNSALRGQKIDQAILNGATAATVSYLREIEAEQKKADTTIANRDKAYSDYTKKVDEYNKLAEQYNNSTSQKQADQLKAQLDSKLAEINKLSESIGAMNKQLADMQTKVNDLTNKAKTEMEKTGGDYSDKVIADISDTEQALLARIQEASTREFGTMEDQIQYAEYKGGPTVIDVRGTYKIIAETPTAEINEAGVMFDKKTGSVIGELTDDELRQLRERLDLPTQTSETIGADTLYGGTTGETGTTTAGGGGGGKQEILNATIADLTYQEQFYKDQAAGAAEELQRLQKLRDDAQATIEKVSPNAKADFEKELKAINDEIARVTDIQTKANDAAEAAATERDQLETELGTRLDKETEDALLAAEEARLAREAAKGTGGAPTGGGTGGVIENIDDELDRIENELANADEEAAKEIRDNLADEVKGEIGGGTGGGTALPDDVVNEINDILDEYDRNKGETKPAAPTEGGDGAAPQPEDGGAGAGPTDEEILDLIGIGGGGTGTGETGTGGAGEGAGGTGGGTGAGTGEGAGEEPTPKEEVPAEGETATDGAMTTTVTIPGRRTPPTGEARSISSRVTGEALVGILGEKEPLFGGDEDQQRAVWNRRSLRLRRALGL